MKILILTDIPYPTDHSFLEEVYNKRLPNYGHKVSWVMRSKEKINERVKHTSWYGNKVYLLKNYGVRSFKYTFKTYFVIFRELKKILKEYNADIIIVRNDPLMGLMVNRYCKRNNKKFIFQYSFFKARGHKNKKGINSFIKYHLGQSLENYLIKNADHVFPISKYMANELKKELKVSSNKLTPFTLGVDETHTMDTNNTSIKNKLGLGNSVVIYLGALDNSRNPKFIIETFKLVLKEVPESQLLLIGDTVNKEELEDLKYYVRNIGLSNNKVIFTGRIKRENIKKYISLGDVCLSPIPPKPTYKIASPIKIMDYLLNERPVVVNKEIIDQGQIVQEGNCGFSVPYNTTDFSVPIIKLLKNKRLCKEMGKAGKKYILKNRSYQSITQKLNDILLEINN